MNKCSKKIKGIH